MIERKVARISAKLSSVIDLAVASYFGWLFAAARDSVKRRIHREPTVLQVSNSLAALGVDRMVAPMLRMLRSMASRDGAPFSRWTPQQRLQAAESVRLEFDALRSDLEKGRGRRKKKRGLIENAMLNGAAHRAEESARFKVLLKQQLVPRAAGVRLGEFIKAEGKTDLLGDLQASKAYVSNKQNDVVEHKARANARIVQDFIKDFHIDSSKTEALEKFLSRHEPDVADALRKFLNDRH